MQGNKKKKINDMIKGTRKRESVNLEHFEDNWKREFD